MDYAQVDSNAYSESGADALDLNVDRQLYRELMLSAAIGAAYRVAAHLQLTADTGVSYNALNTPVELTAAFAGGGDSFITRGLDVSPWLYTAGVGAIGLVKDNVELRFYYGVQASTTGLVNQLASAVFRIRL